MKTVALYNLGCKVNSYELEGMGQKLRDKGYRIVPFEEKADIYIVNTCTVTNIADRKSRQMLHRAKQRNPEAVVVAVGCYVQTGLAKVEQDESIDLAIGNNHKKDIVEFLEKYLEERQKEKLQDSGGEAFREEAMGEEDVSESGKDGGKPQEDPGGKTLHGATVMDMNQNCEYEEMQLRQSTEHTRAYIKIQDGCNQFCSYCVIPYARGRVRSRRSEDILEEIRGLTEAGCMEVVLTGIHISSYGIDFRMDGNKAGGTSRMWQPALLSEEDASTFPAGQAPPGHVIYTGSSRLLDLVEQIHDIPGLKRIRLGSLEPRIIKEETARRLAALPKICPHFHLSLQSGCDATLKRMNRHYTTGEYYTCVETLRRWFPEPAITTDVIVGFPGETEEEFALTKAFLEKVNFYEVHVFKYSRRAGTRADKMPDQVPEPVKTGRSAILLELTSQQSRAFRAHYIGKKAEVLLEEKREIEGRTLLTGHTKDYVTVAVDGAEGVWKKNTIVTVPVKAFLTEEILI